MNPVFVKICGITNPADAEAAIEFGADALGFNLWPRSKRFLPIHSAAAWIEELPDSVRKVAVMVNPAKEEAQRVFELPFIDMVQFHGEETPEFCAGFSRQRQPLIKAMALRDSSAGQEAARYSTPYILLDAYAPGQFGGTGKTIDWDLAARFVGSRPDLKVLLSGGLTPENVREAVGRVRPFGVDIASGVESAPGKKDHARMKAFIQAAKERS